MPVKHMPRKRFGQNFLVDRGVVARIVDAIDPQPDDNLVEIGPGLGALTGFLLERARRLLVIEIDRDLAARLRVGYPGESLVVCEGDALRFDFSTLPGPLRIVGNLPYNISTPFLFHVARHAERCADLHFMLQREVVERMVASPATGAYGRLSVMLQYRFAMQQLFGVPSSAFRPVPKVDSAVVRLVPRARAECQARDEAVFARTVARAFSQRRKTLRNALKDVLGAQEFDAVGIDPGLRAEDLSVAQFVALANRVC